MKPTIDGKAIVYADGVFNTTYGKTAHGLVRFTERYEITGVIDHVHAGQDAGMVLDGRDSGIWIYKDLEDALRGAGLKKAQGTFVLGVATDGGGLPESARVVVKKALKAGLNVDSGLHEFLYRDESIAAMARRYGCRIRDVRRTPERENLHFFSGKIEKVDCLKIAVLGTDSAVGKRTTAWIVVHEFRGSGLKAEMIGTGQTAWMQGAKYSMILDSCINDFVSGEIEHAVHEAWINESPDLIMIEGQGSLMNPAYPGGYEILAAGRPDYVILQHAPRRMEYDGFPGYPLHPLRKQIEAIHLISGKEVMAITLNHELMKKSEILPECKKIANETGIPVFDVLEYGSAELVSLIKGKLK